jgi:homoserine O-acetyltransferase
MVSAQHRLVTEHLGIRRLRLIIGGSMGGMHAWLWATTYPEAMDAIMPLQCLPVEIAGMNRMLRRAVTDSIRADPDWRNGEYTAQPRRALAAIEYGWIALFGDPLALMTAAPTRAQADRMFDARVEARQRGTDVNDTLYQLEASRDYNPAPDLGRIRARVFAANTEDDSVNPPYLGVMEPAIAKIPRASYVVIPRGAGTAGHGSYSIGKLYTRFVADILNRR